MTICIAAAAMENGEPRIVLVSDAMVSTETWSTETGWKLAELWIGHLYGLYAGDPADAKELAAIYRSYLPTVEIKGDDIADHLRVPLQIYKNRMANAVTGKLLGFTLEDFLARKDQIPEDVVTKVYNDILYADRGADFIACGFFPDDYQQTKAKLFGIVRDDVREESDFLCIGSGSEAATQSLHRREQQAHHRLDQTLYHAYEAKRAGELSPKVGPYTRVHVLEPGAQGGPYRLRRILPHVEDLLIETFHKYGKPQHASFRVPDGKRYADE